MTDLIILTVAALLCMLAFGCIGIKAITIQQRTIDRMADRLMARDYREYTSMQPKPATPQKTRRDPMSWYDEPDIEGDDVQN